MTHQMNCDFRNVQIKEHESLKQVVSARDLHQFIASKQQFSNWIKKRIARYQFIENQDYVAFNKKIKCTVGATIRKEYAITINMAKQLAMVENNAKGLEIRQYFIKCEKELRSRATPKQLYSNTIVEFLLLNHLEPTKIKFYSDLLIDCCMTSPSWINAIEEKETLNILNFLRSLPNVYNSIPKLKPKQKLNYVSFRDFANEKGVCDRIHLGKAAAKICREKGIAIQYNRNKSQYPLSVLEDAYKRC